jgi:aminodeoxyfutalosine synthase
LIARESPSNYDLRIIAIARLLLGNILDNISVYWVSLGKKIAQVALTYGGNDLVGTAFSEEIFRAAGKTSGISIQELVNLIKEIKREPAQRDTFFNVIEKY